MYKKISEQQKKIIKITSANRFSTLKTIKYNMFPNLYNKEGLYINKNESNVGLFEFLTNCESNKQMKLERNKVTASIHRSLSRLIEDGILYKINKYYIIHPEILDKWNRKQ